MTVPRRPAVVLQRTGVGRRGLEAGVTAGGGSVGRYARVAVPVAILVLVVIAAVQTVLARQDLSAAATDLSAAIHAAASGQGLDSAAQRGVLMARVEAAHDHFVSAESELWPWDPVLGHVGWLPAVGPQAEAAYPLADAGMETTGGVLDVLRGLSGVWSRLHDRRSGVMARLAPALAGGGRSFRAAAGSFRAASQELGSVPAGLGSRSIDRQVKKLRNAMPTLESAALWLGASPWLLGDRGPSRILLVWENPDQIRPTGGFIPAANFITVSHGRITTKAFGSFFLPQSPIGLPAPEAAYTGEGSLLFEDSNWSPDFPLSARYERWMFGVATGLIAPTVVDVSGAGAILQATGPIYVAPYRRWVTARNAAYWIEYYHLLYVRHTQINPTDTKSQQFLADLFAAIMRHIQHLGVRGLVRLARGFHQAIGSQTILMWSRNPGGERAIASVGAEGVIDPSPGDSLFVVDDNLSYNKINPYISEAATYDVSISRSLETTAVLRIRYHNRKSPANLYGTGPFDSRRAKHTYQDLVRVYVPPGANVTARSGLRCPAAGKGEGFCAVTPAYGMSELLGGFTVKESATDTVTYRYRLPSSIFERSGPDRYVLYIRKQPSSRLRVRVNVKVGPGMSVGRPGARRVGFTVALRRPVTVVSERIWGASGAPQALRLRTGPWSDPWLPNSVFNTPRQSF